MSGIFGLYNQDEAPVTPSEMRPMASLLERRGPDRTGLWHKGQAGLGHTLLATTPEALFELIPLSHSASGCTITADVRLDNREQLLTNLGLIDRKDTIGDAEIILQAYLVWHDACVEHLMGDFAFAIHDARRKTLFCARDHFGVRPFYYHYTSGRLFVFASEPRAILALKKVPNKLNEGRIADFLISQLEGIDKTSTFYEEVYRLPPAHTLTISPDSIQIKRYWTLEPGPELQLNSDEAYAEAFLEVFTEAVRCRLRSAGPVGSMLSGGMDSGSIVAIAKDLLAKEGKGPLPTFSAIGPDSTNCTETRTTLLAQSLEGIEPHSIRYDQLDELLPELAELTWRENEPFDNHMTLVRSVYLLAQRRGVKVVMDGIDGDSVLSEGSQITRLLRGGRLLTAYREAVGQNHFWQGAYPAWQQLYRSSRAAFAPNVFQDLRQQLTGKQRSRKNAEKNINTSIINREFSRRVNLEQRMQMLNSHREPAHFRMASAEAAKSLDHPYLTVAVERYNRVASSVAIEPRHPFLDQRLLAFCITLPGNQKINEGWPKIILRRSMQGRLPDTVRWRRGKEHLGWDFTRELIGNTESDVINVINKNNHHILPYVDLSIVKNDLLSFNECVEIDKKQEIYETACLASWLENFMGKHQ